MGQKMLQADGTRQISGCTPGHKAGQQFAQRRFQFELSALDKQHCRSRGRYNLGQARDVVNGSSGHGRRVFFISESSQGPLEHELIASQNSKCASREGPRRNGVFQDPKGSGKPIGLSEGFLSRWRSLRGHRFLVG